MTFSLGEMLQAGKYRLDALIEERQWGMTFLATHLSVNQPVLIKTFQATDTVEGPSRAQVDSFLHYAKTLTRFHHPQLSRVSSTFEEGQRVCMVSEFIQGESLSQLIHDGGKRTHDVYAHTSVRLIHVSERALTQLLNEHPIYWHDFGVLLTEKVRSLFDSLEDHALLTAKQKVSKRLYMLCHSSGQTRLPLSQQQLADMTYLTRQTVNQILQSLQTESVISLKYQIVEIENIDKLLAQC